MHDGPGMMGRGGGGGAFVYSVFLKMGHISIGNIFVNAGDPSTPNISWDR